MKQIQPIQIWSPNGFIEISFFSLLDFCGYKFDDGVGYVTYELIGTDSIPYYNNTIEVPANIIQQWGADDDIIWQYVATALGLSIV